MADAMLVDLPLPLTVRKPLRRIEGRTLTHTRDFSLGPRDTIFW